ncbi:MAG: lytic murein transglycosylase [Pseudolabrys sp.]
MKLTAAAMGALWAGQVIAATCQNTNGSYAQWLEAFKKDAAAQGISQKVIAAAAPSMTFDPAIIKRDHGQAVFGQSFLQFSDRMVGSSRIPSGLAKMKQYAAGGGGGGGLRQGRGAIRRAGAGAHGLLGPGERLRRRLRQIQNSQRARDFGI